jgi:hypothetical protein
MIETGRMAGSFLMQVHHLTFSSKLGSMVDDCMLWCNSMLQRHIRHIIIKALQQAEGAEHEERETDRISVYERKKIV